MLCADTILEQVCNGDWTRMTETRDQGSRMS